MEINSNGCFEGGYIVRFLFFYSLLLFAERNDRGRKSNWSKWSGRTMPKMGKTAIWVIVEVGNEKNPGCLGYSI